MLETVRPVVLAGKAAVIDARGRRSAIAKRAIPGPWHVTKVGLAGDEQADLKNHGGQEKAVHHYPFDHYRTWAEDIGPHPLLASPGAFGENISATGWTEQNVHIGDIVRFGTALLQVSQGRQPCWKLNARFDRSDMSMLTQSSGHTGWYYRVLEEGEADEQNVLELVERRQTNWPIARLTRLLYIDTRHYDELQEMTAIEELAQGWRNLAARRVETRTTENWSPRLTGET